MQEKEQKADARHEDDKLLGAGITHLIAKFVKGVASGQETSENERDMPPKMASRGQETSQHADITPERGPEKRQHLQQLPKPKHQLLLKLQPELQHELTPKFAPTPTGWW